MSLLTDAQKFASDPASFFDRSDRAAHSIQREDLDDLQLAALKWRFSEHRDSIAMLKTLADEQKKFGIENVDDVITLLFPHTVYKSYPVSLLLKNRFDHLTRWLGRLTTCDLSGVDVAACDGIDSWIDTLDKQTDLRVSHSSGTSGTVSFTPRTHQEWEQWYDFNRMMVFGVSDPEQRDRPGEYFDLIWPTFRYGYSGQFRAVPYQIKYLAGSEERFHSMSDKKVSADVMFLAAQMRAAAARGEQFLLDPDSPIMKRRKEQEEIQRSLADNLPRFLAEMADRLAGRRVLLIGLTNLHYDMARSGLDKGLRHVFSPDSVVMTGGGAKGLVLPSDWDKQVQEFAGVNRVTKLYGMTEVKAVHVMCPHGRYHMQPWIIPFILDPNDGTPFPRTGIQTGRLALFDLTTSTQWGGFVSGDEVTINWSTCSCGRTTPSLGDNIGRYSEKNGGDDKISCAAQAEAHAEALEFLVGGLTQ